MNATTLPTATTLALALLLTACGADDAADAGAGADRSAAVEAPAGPAGAATATEPVRRAATGELPPVVVFKTEACGCCNGWVEHLRAAGFEVDARNVTDLGSVKVDAGVPRAMSSCHTALIDGYVVEGHVPADVVKKLLAERPDVDGIATPGMPIGSPGMEGPGARPYQVHAFERSGETRVYAEVDPR